MSRANLSNFLNDKLNQAVIATALVAGACLYLMSVLDLHW
ncbi:hypothetical protein J2X36_004529 [Methylobacterium sp. BE186]|nr:hypothetical protein [Methylobacterium sp. BE186]